MSFLGIDPVLDPSVRVDVRQQGASSATVSFAGVLSHRDPGPLLAPMFKRLHEVLLERSIGEVRVDLRELRFMNSASFKHFVTWIRANGSLEPRLRYRIHFILNPRHHWQKVSIHALSCFSIEEITVEEREEGDP